MTFVATFIAMILACLAMALGVLTGRSPLRRGCDGGAAGSDCNVSCAHCRGTREAGAPVTNALRHGEEEQP